MQIDVLRPQDLSAERVARWGELQAADIELDTPFLAPGWARLHVLSYSASGSARLFVFEPDPWGALTWSFGDFYVRGPAREVEHDNNPRRARERFDEVPKE